MHTSLVVNKAKQIEEEYNRKILLRGIVDLCLKKQDGVFHLTSGEARQVYFDLKQITLNPTYISIIVEELKRIILKSGIPWQEIQSVGGLETGSIPIISHLTNAIGARGFYVRKEPKRHALRNTIEGTCIAPYILVDDVVTTGFSMNQCESYLVDNGFGYARAKLVILDRRSTVYEDRNDVKTIFTEEEIK